MTTEAEPQFTKERWFKICDADTQRIVYNLLTQKELLDEYERKYLNPEMPKIPKIKADRWTVSNWLDLLSEKEIDEMLTDLINGDYTIEKLRQDYYKWGGRRK